MSFGAPEDGCCGGTTATACMYVTEFTDAIDEITSITYKKDGVDTTILVGVEVDATDMNAIHAVIMNALTQAEPTGAGLIYHPGDIAVYQSDFNETADMMTIIEIISGVEMVSMDINTGGDTLLFDQGCVSGTYCLYLFNNTLATDLTIFIDNTPLGAVNEATVGALVTSIDAALDAAGYTTAVILGKENADDPGIADLKLWLPVNSLSVVVDGAIITRHHCELMYIIS